MIINRNDLDWAEVLLEDFNRARALTVYLMVKYSEWDQLINLDCDPSGYLAHSQLDFRKDYQATNLFRKCADLPSSYDTKQEAIKAFWLAEDMCSRTNRRLYPLMKSLNGVHHYGVPVWIQEFTKDWQKEIKTLLGPIPNSLEIKFSSGSTFDDRRYITVMDKISSRPTCTSSAYELIEPFWSRTLWSRSLCEEVPNRSSPRIIRGNRFTTVPKTAKTDRGICVEPSLNVTHQLGVGSVIRKRLRSDGIDLKFGQSHHRKLVAEASLTLGLATIDLSMASDTVSLGLVELLFPPLWLELLSSLRSPETYIEGSWHKNAKFSSMGNGFTFELETLIFYSLAKVIGKSFGIDKSDISVYGDDIIVPVPMAAKLLEALAYFGFTPNVKKTYVGDVPFRESCGEDYFNGVPVRGHYVEKIPTNPLEWTSLANGLRRMARYDLSIHGDLHTYTRSWLRCQNHIPTNYKCFGPVHLGDTVIHTDDTTWWSTRSKSNIHELRVIRPIFSDDSYSHVDKRCWTRGSILSAIALGSLKGSGLRHKLKKDGTYRAIPTQFVKSRASVTGWKTSWVSLSHSNAYPAWVVNPSFGFRKDPKTKEWACVPA